MEKQVPFIVGYVSMQSNLSLEAVASILSEKLFGGVEFGGKELEIHEEVPAVFLDIPILGMKVVFDGYSGFDDENHFTLSITPWNTFDGIEQVDVRIDNYLICLLKDVLKDTDSIEVME